MTFANLLQTVTNEHFVKSSGEYGRWYIDEKRDPRVAGIIKRSLKDRRKVVSECVLISLLMTVSRLTASIEDNSNYASAKVTRKISADSHIGISPYLFIHDVKRYSNANGTLSHTMVA